jgi:ABC-2 type transport system ATP-binding protein
VANKKDLLNKLHQETFLLDLSRPINDSWQSSYTVRVIDTTTLEVDVTRDQSINGMFAELSREGIEVTSMRNKANRLEELFIRIVAGDETQAGVDASTGLEDEGAGPSGEGVPR